MKVNVNFSLEKALFFDFATKKEFDFSTIYFIKSK